jgi:flagellar biosynthesis protein FlhA
VPIRDMVSILEALGDAADTTKDPEALTEHVRRALTNVIARMYAEPDGSVRGVTMGPKLEAALVGLFSPRQAGPNQGAGMSLLNPDSLAGLLRDLNVLVSAHAADGRPVPLITPPTLRVAVRRLIEPVLPQVPVISLAELPPQVSVSSVATWEVKHAA